MSEYKCFVCGKIIDENYIKKKVRCIYCGSKIIFKRRSTITKVKAR
ncbi:MAG: DNA-directed RNA polymerase subunit P [Nanoarchaeota archaeon]